MTQPMPPGQPVAPVDTGNGLLAEGLAQWTTSLAETPAGQRCVLTIRTPSTTLTIILAKADADSFATQLRNEAAKMSGSGLIVAPGNGLPGGVVKGHG